MSQLQSILQIAVLPTTPTESSRLQVLQKMAAGLDAMLKQCTEERNSLTSHLQGATTYTHRGRTL